MPATPAYPPESLPRLFVDRRLENGTTVELTGNQAHYLGNVLRLEAGAGALLFDDRTGEYRATIAALRKRSVTLDVGERVRPREDVPDLWLLAAPIKRDRFGWVVEKATELGVARFQPVRTQRTQGAGPRPERLRSHMIEAAEQCERTALPELAPQRDLFDMLSDWPGGRSLFFADERAFGSGEGDLRAALANHPGPAAILIGPEGGFTTDEDDCIRGLSASVPVSLGPRILRADTAAVAAIGVWMAAHGDWVRDS